MALPQVVLQYIKISFQGVHCGAKAYWISPASLWNSTTVTTLALILIELADEELGEDDVFVLESIAEAKKNEEDKLRVTIILTMKDSMVALAKVVKIIEVIIWFF